MERNSLKRGFTLVELMFTLTVSGVLVAMALPSIRNFVEIHAAKDAVHRLTASLALARLSAVQRSRATGVCPSRDGVQCRRDGVWDEGWIVFSAPGPGGPSPDGADILEVAGGPGHGIRFRSSSHRSLVRYGRRGWAAGHNLTIELCTPRLGATHRLVVNNAGRARAEKLDPNETCQH